MRFRRIRDGQMVPDTEACDANGTVKDGYSLTVGLGQRFVQPGDYIGFDMAFLDSARPSGSPAASALSANHRAAIIARAEMIHRTTNAYLGDRAPAFTDTMAQLAVHKAESDMVRLQANDVACTAGADKARIECEVARAQMISNIQNAWRK